MELIFCFFLLIVFYLMLKNKEKFTMRPHIANSMYKKYREYIDKNFKNKVKNTIKFNRQLPILFNSKNSKNSKNSNYDTTNMNIPYKISPNCFDDRYRKCFYYRKDKISNKQKLLECEKMSLNSCIIPLMTSENYMGNI